MKPSTPSHGRSAAGIAISAALHTLAFTGMVWLAMYAPDPVRRAVPSPAAHQYVLTFLRAPEMPLALRMAAKKTVDAPHVDPVRMSEPAPLAHVEPKPLPVVAPAPPSPVHAPDPDLVSPVKPVIAKALEVGVFDKAVNTAQNPTPGRQVVETAGFDTTPAQAPEIKLPASTSLGGFDRAASTTPRPGTDKPVGSVADAGFGGAARGAPARPPAAQTRGEIRAGAFDIQPAPAPATAAAALARSISRWRFSPSRRRRTPTRRVRSGSKATSCSKWSSAPPDRFGSCASSAAWAMGSMSRPRAPRDKSASIRRKPAANLSISAPPCASFFA
jgi:hypothetical protein